MWRHEATLKGRLHSHRFETYILPTFLKAHLHPGFTHAIFGAISDAISRTKRALPCPVRMIFSLIIVWIGNKFITYYLKTPFFPISANLAVFCRSVRCINGLKSTVRNSPEEKYWTNVFINRDLKAHAPRAQLRFRRRVNFKSLLVPEETHTSNRPRKWTAHNACEVSGRGHMSHADQSNPKSERGGKIGARRHTDADSIATGLHTARCEFPRYVFVYGIRMTSDIKRYDKSPRR